MVIVAAAAVGANKRVYFFLSVFRQETDHLSQILCSNKTVGTSFAKSVFFFCSSENLKSHFQVFTCHPQLQWSHLTWYSNQYSITTTTTTRVTTKSPLSPLFAAFLQELILDCWTLTHNNKKVNGGGANTQVGGVVTDLSRRAVSALCVTLRAPFF